MNESPLISGHFRSKFISNILQEVGKVGEVDWKNKNGTEIPLPMGILFIRHLDFYKEIIKKSFNLFILFPIFQTRQQARSVVLIDRVVNEHSKIYIRNYVEKSYKIYVHLGWRKIIYTTSLELTKIKMKVRLQRTAEG